MLVRPSRDGCSASAPRRGVVLLAVLMVVAVLTLAAYEYSSRMLEEYQAVNSQHRQAQAKLLADSGVHYVAIVLSDPDGASTTFNNNLSNNPQAFQVQPNDAASYNGRFTLIRPMDPDDPNYGDPYYTPGITDESSKINLNALMKLDSTGTAANNILINLPNMTDELADAILNWLAPATPGRPNMNSDTQYYQSLSPPYSLKNGPLDTLGELLRVRGVTPDLLYGQDYNRSGVPGPDQPANGSSGSNAAIDRGWAAYLTMYSREPNVDVKGNGRLNVNRQIQSQNDVQQLISDIQTALTGSNGFAGDAPTIATFIVAGRIYGVTAPTPANPSGTGAKDDTTAKGKTPAAKTGGVVGPIPANQLNLSGRAQSISSLYQLIGGTVSVPATTPQGQPTTYASPITLDPTSLTNYAAVFDALTTVNAPELPARVNIKTAPRAVLMALPVFNGGNTTSGSTPTTSTEVDWILSQRATAQDSTEPIYQTPLWLLTDPSSPLTINQLQTLDKYITSRSFVVRVQSIGDFTTGGPSARVEAVIDLSSVDQTQGVAPGTRRPRIVYYHDLTELGKGVSLPNQNQ